MAGIQPYTDNVQASSFQDLDLESMLMLVQMTRVGNLEQQLSAQLSSVQAKNQTAGKLNNLLGMLNKAAAMFGGDSNASTEIGSTDGWKKDTSFLEKNVNDAIMNANIGDAGLSGAPGGGMLDTTTKGQLDGLIAQVKSKLDEQSNSQQMDMLRLQSLSSKRNEAFDIMTNFMKKMADGRASIVANMR